MLVRRIPVIALVTSLSACVGGSDGSAVNPVEGPGIAKVLAFFDDGDGVATSTLTLDGETQIANAIVQDVYGAVDDINIIGLNITSVTSTNLGSDGLGTLYEGTSKINGELVNVRKKYTDNGPSWIILAESATISALIAGGAKVSNIPAGSYVYRGTNAVGYRDRSKDEIGTFEMAVDFSSGTANINGSTATSTITGNMDVNNQTGTFSGNNILLSEVSGAQASGTIFGNFHGDGATAVSGVYYENSLIPVVAGAIAGSR